MRTSLKILLTLLTVFVAIVWFTQWLSEADYFISSLVATLVAITVGLVSVIISIVKGRW